ncbi:MAG: hypothetical protein OEM02_01085 [Desulfobulbaceae bacterium]|nr:hypothetical protein [Desulfobulbaceae bacterium]
MQIDFHHGVTYVIARLAGFDHHKGLIVAYCSQYVDDATEEGLVNFNNGAMYRRIKSSHKMIGYDNFNKLANHQVWIPFHFLPGNGGKKAGDNPDGTFINKIICRPNSPVAKDMVRNCINDRNKPYGLHRLGVTMHVYADTWAHQGFAGVTHKINNITGLCDFDNPNDKLESRLLHYFGNKIYNVASGFINDALPLGHGAALSYPDQPYLKWEYHDHNGQIVVRDNTAEFTTAADEMCKEMQRFIAGDSEADVPGLPYDDKRLINRLMKEINDKEGEDRHKKWLHAIGQGDFSFPAVTLTYSAEQQTSWKNQALDIINQPNTKSKNHAYAYHDSFLESHWKRFHDALLAHRFSVVHDILPNYGICAA